jgi:hypothetical protein
MSTRTDRMEEARQAYRRQLLDLITLVITTQQRRADPDRLLEIVETLTAYARYPQLFVSEVPQGTVSLSVFGQPLVDGQPIARQLEATLTAAQHVVDVAESLGLRGS